jgi:hypothetical protein
MIDYEINSDNNYKINENLRTSEFLDAKATFPIPTMSPSDSPSGSKILENHSTVLSPVSTVRDTDTGTGTDVVRGAASPAEGASAYGGLRDFLLLSVDLCVAAGSDLPRAVAESVLLCFCFRSAFDSTSTDSDVVVLLKSAFPFFCSITSPESEDAIISDADSALPTVLFLLSLRQFKESFSGIFRVIGVTLRS